MLKEVQQEIDKADLIIAHNAKFDLNWLKYVGIQCSEKKVWCSLVADYLINGQQKIGYSLDACAERHDVPLKNDLMKTFWEDGFETDEIPLAVHVPYLIQDLRTCEGVFLKQLPIVLKADLSKICEVSFDITQILSDMETKGVKFDTDSAKEYVEQYTTLCAEETAELNRLVGFDFTATNPHHLVPVLFGGSIKTDVSELVARTLKSGAVKIRTRKATYDRPVKGLGFYVPDGCTSKATGNVSADKNTLKQLRAKTPEQKEFLDVLLNLKKNSKILSTFVSSDGDSGLMAKVGTDGRIHPNFNQAVTATARLSSSEPNGQNLPRKGTSPIKKVFVPEKGLIVNLDLGQIEWRIAASLSGDEEMIREIRGGLDAHADNAIRFFGADPNARDSKEFKELRTTAKVMTFRLLYGGSATGFYKDQSMPNFSKNKWKQIVDAFYEKYKGLAAWQQGNVNITAMQGYLRNPSGRVLTFSMRNSRDGGQEWDSKQIYNYPVQSCSADIMYLAMREVMREVKALSLDCDLVLQVHDSMVFDCNPKDAHKLCEIGIDVFENLPQLAKEYFNWDITVPLTGDAEIGRTYGSTMDAPRDKWEYIFNNLNEYLDK